MSFEYKKSLGQNFLIDTNIPKKIVNLSEVTSQDFIVEIGGGAGALSKIILDHNPQKFIIIEKDLRLIQGLQLLNQNHNNNGFEVINADALKFDITSIAPQNTKIKLIANLPYNISTQLISNWIEHITIFDRIVVMVQKEVAARITAKPKTKDYGRLGILSQIYCTTTELFDIPPDCFMPQPKVTSTVVELRPKPQNPTITAKDVSYITAVLFNNRRKQMKNALQSLITHFKPNITIDEIYKKLNIHLTARAEEIDIQNFILLIKMLTRT